MKVDRKDNVDSNQRLHDNYKIAMIAVFFGPFPKHFPLFLESCRCNSHIDWIIYTDNSLESLLPQNVRVINTTLEKCKDRFQKYFDYPISLSTPKKLCDYKPLYGFLFQEDLKEYDFWGHTDLDVIYGDISFSSFHEIDGDLVESDPEIPIRIDDDARFALLGKYDKLYTLGHFSLYRNSEEVNNLPLAYKNGQRIKEVLTDPKLIAFDEWGPNNINDIFMNSDMRFLNVAYGADIWPERSLFSLSKYVPELNKYRQCKNSEGILKWRTGHLYYGFIDAYKDIKWVEVPYVHFQKRKMPLLEHVSANEFYITSAGFLDGQVGINKAISIGKHRTLIDHQFFRIKWKAIKRRLRMEQ